METTMEFTREVTEALGAAFPEDEVEFLPRGFYNGKARALAYIDARSVMRRLDAVVGPGNWSFDFDVMSPDCKMVKGRLTVLGVTKCDAGEAAAEDEVLKSAVSDALKRCGVHFGIGRYLYYLPQVWAPYDQQKRRFTEAPRISPDAVNRALAVCGISSNGRPAAPAVYTAAHGSAPDQGVEPAGSEANGGAGRDSIWAAGGRREANGAGAAPSRGGARTAGSAEASPERSAARTESRPAAAPSTPAAGSVPVDPSTLVCSGGGCGKALTRGQHDISIRAFGQPLCPACQKERARAAA